jgi:uncharacterized protein (TIGR03067 family)
MRLTIGLAACVLLIAAEDKGKDKKADALTGTWKVTSLEVGGMDVEQAKGSLFTFKEGKLTMKSERGERVSTYKIDASKKPATIDTTAQGGQQDGMTRMGIYEVKGDDLTLCIAFMGDERPKKFTGEEAGIGLIKLKREKAEDAGKAKEKAPEKKSKE